jgi:hypothetical protein|tara:strand:+ start:201 stop:377 length:177 start_codon:yes stop_codon:yes gene_type:complete
MERITKEAIEAKLRKRLEKHFKGVDASRKAFEKELKRQKSAGHVPESSGAILLTKLGK